MDKKRLQQLGGVQPLNEMHEIKDLGEDFHAAFDRLYDYIRGYDEAAAGQLMAKMNDVWMFLDELERKP